MLRTGVSEQARHVVAEKLDANVVLLLFLAVLSWSATFFANLPALNFALYVFSGSILIAAAYARAVVALKARAAAQHIKVLKRLVDADDAPCFFSSSEGGVIYLNKSAQERYGLDENGSLATLLAKTFANPAALLFRLQSKSASFGSAHEDVVTRKGHLRLNVHAVPGQGYLWRLEELSNKASGSQGAEAISLPMITVGQSGAVLFCNDACRRFLGSRPKSIDRLILGGTVENGAICEIETSYGPTYVRLAVLPASGGRQEVFMMPMSDGEAEIGQSAMPPDVFENLPVALLEISKSSGITRSNNEALNLLERRSTEGLKLDEVLDPAESNLSDWVLQVFSDPGTTYVEVLRLKNSEPEKFLEVTLLNTGSGADAALFAMLNDATELKTLEAQFVQSQKMQAIGQLAGGVAHDFNNLLTAISGHCDLLLLRHDKNDQDYADLIQIHQNANRAASLVGQLLAFSRKQNLKPEVIDLRDTLSELSHLLNRLVGEKVSFGVTNEDVLPKVRVDKRQFEQVIMNLVVNARDAMPDGGCIALKTESVVLDRALHRDRAIVPEGHYVRVIVDDEGCGIPPEKLAKIFEPFYTTKRQGEGTGLGLSMAYGIVKQTGGFIFVDSVIGTGTKFTIYFPTHEEEEPITPTLAKPRAFDHSDPKDGVVLLVEDEAPVRAFASRALQLRGFKVIEAACAEDALEKLEDDGLEVDIFVTDVVMPGMDGPTWVRMALEKRPDVRVVFVSGYAEQVFEDGSMNLENSVFLPKPFSLDDLTATVQEQLH
ncbi:MAG: ATP-binding protein [Pseudomonadota bacterium]